MIFGAQGGPAAFPLRRTRREPRGSRDLPSHRTLLGLAALGAAGEARRGLVGCHAAVDGSTAVLGQWISDLQWSSPRGFRWKIMVGLGEVGFFSGRSGSFLGCVQIVEFYHISRKKSHFFTVHFWNVFVVVHVFFIFFNKKTNRYEIDVNNNLNMHCGKMQTNAFFIFLTKRKKAFWTLWKWWKWCGTVHRAGAFVILFGGPVPQRVGGGPPGCLLMESWIRGLVWK